METTNAKQTTVLLGTALIQLTTIDNVSHVFRAVLDTGSTVNLISEHAAHLLNAPRQFDNLIISGISANNSNTKGFVTANLKTLANETLACNMPFHVLKRISLDIPRIPVTQDVVNKTSKYVLADPTFNVPSSVDILLGNSIVPFLYEGNVVPLGNHMPLLQGSKLGFLVVGSAPAIHCDSYGTTVAHSTLSLSLLTTTESDSLHNSLQRFWTQEELPVINHKSKEEIFCDEFFSSTYARNHEGRFIVRLPFKTNTTAVLGTSRPVAENRLLSMERKFNNDSQFSDLYHDFMNDYITSGHMEKIDSVSSPHYYLPHHGVLKTGSSTTRLRAVFDGSALTSTKTSLNDILLTGRKLQTNICDVLLNFRSHNVVFSCDIKQMYRQILVHPDDRNYQLILWRDNPQQEIASYRLNTVTYGLNCSPYLAIKTIHQLAQDEGHDLPLASHALLTSCYIDDIVTGAASTEDALELQDQLITLLSRGGFQLRKWSSNSPEVLARFPADHLETPKFLHDSEMPQYSILGLQWIHQEDSFCYHFTSPTSAITKRSVLSVIARLYDPCGFLSPLLMWAKGFMQLLWTQGLNWDTPLSPELADKWHTFTQDTSRCIADIKILRSFELSDTVSIQLHGFCDASELGYAAVLYFRCEHSNGNITVRLILSKTRVAPLKKITLPRLELCGAHLLAKLTSYCKNQLSHVNIEQTFLWCDSTVALSWLQTPPYRLKTYVANRVADIQELIPSHSWHHIPGTDNPADVASRGILASHLCTHSLWWSGPQWLSSSSQHWPTTDFTPIDVSTSGEYKPPTVNVLTTLNEEWNLLSRFSSWPKLLRVTSYVLRFSLRCQNKPTPTGHLRVQELNHAQIVIFRIVQKHAFSDDLKLLSRNSLCSAKLRRLSPFLDNDGLIRVGGRLSNSTLPHDARHPIVLPKKHHVSMLLIDYFHRVHLHSGPQLTQALLSKKVWILSARSAIRSCIHKCMTCFRHRPTTKTPLMGDLPATRVVPTRPFLITGMDYAGPFSVRVHNLRALRQIKTYLCIFICMAVKAIHIEVVTDLTSEGFIAALTRFVSRRGLCSDLYSDCGTNFVGANTILKHIVRENIHSPSSSEKISRFSVERGINFHFNPPAAPHQGGLWESAVKSAKHHLHRVIGDTVLTLSQFQTLTIQVEAMLNSRPLTPLSTDPTETDVLTPGHFLIGAPLAAVPEPSLQGTPLNRLRQWQLVKALHQHIWNRWQLEYLHSLQQRLKWTSPQEDLRLGQLVLVHAPTPPLTWPLGRITALHPGKDGTVRVVRVKTAAGTLTRPAIKVYPIPTDSQNT